jgi:HSP20 family molecular chaperone IbpA
MASQTGAAKAKKTEVVSSVFVEPDQQSLLDRLHRDVARRAFELSLDGGAAAGNDLENWLRAESEILSKPPVIRELSSWFTLNIPVEGFAPRDIKVAIDKDRGIVAGENRQADEGATSSDGSRDSFYIVADWPSPVDPTTATAFIKNETLTLTVKRAVHGDNKQPI